MQDHEEDETNTAELGALLSKPRLAQDEKDRLVALLYPELRRLAEAHMRRERPDHTLQATALVSEFYLRLSKSASLGSGTGAKANFLAAASRAMRRLLVDHARTKGRDKRGAGSAHVPLDDSLLLSPEPDRGLSDLDLLLDELQTQQPRLAQVVELRFFGGLSNAEVGEIVGVHERTVKRDWHVARAWLHFRLGEGK